MKFIRKNGRIIPIGEKKENKNNGYNRSNLVKQDAAVGFARTALSVSFFKRPKLIVGLNLASFGHSLYTTKERFKNEKSKKRAALESVKGGSAKLIADGVGFVVAGTSLFAANKLNKLRKLRK